MRSESKDMWVVMLEAEVPFTTRVVGMALMKRADRQTGQINLSMEDFLTLCQGENEQAAKRHLTRLKQAGILHYSSRGDGPLNIFVTFLEWEGEEVDVDNAGMSESSWNGSIESTSTEQRPDPFQKDGGGMLPPYAGPDSVKILLEQVALLQSQVGELQTTIGLLCQRLGVQAEGPVEAEVKEEMRGSARVGFGALGALGDDGASEMARERAERGAKRDDFRREGVEQTEVCLLVNSNSTPGDLNNKQTGTITENALNVAREEAIRCVAVEKCLAPHDAEISERGGAKDARHLSGATHRGVRDGQMTESSRKGSVQPSHPDQRPDPFLEDGASMIPPAIPLDEQDITFKLLTDPEIGISDHVAKRFAQSHHFDYVRRQLFAWQKEIALGKVEGVGALVHRIRMGFGAPEPSMAQQESDLYQRHRTSFEIEAEEKARESYRAMMDVQDKAQSQPQPKAYPLLAPVAPEIWEQTMSRLHKEFYGNSIFTNFVQPMRLLGVHNGVHVIGLPNEQLRYHAHQYKGIVRRTLGQFVDNHQVGITFEVIKVNREKGLFKAGDYVGRLEQLSI